MTGKIWSQPLVELICLNVRFEGVQNHTFKKEYNNSNDNDLEVKIDTETNILNI